MGAGRTGKGWRRRDGGEGWSWQGEAGAGRCRCMGVVALGSLQDPRGMQEALVGCRGEGCREQHLPQVPQPARSILGTQRWLRGVGGEEEKDSGLLLPLARGSPSTVPTVAQPHSHPGTAGTSTRGMPGWHSLVKPAAAKPQSRVWGLQRREAPAYPRGPRAEWDSSPRAPQSWGVPAVPSLWGQTRTSAGVSTAAPLPQPRCSSIPGASSPCPALGRLCGAGRTLTPPALARGNSWHEGAGQGTWLRDDGATPDAFPPGRRNRKHFLIGEPDKPQNNNQRKEERKNQRKPFGEEEFLFH